MDNPALRSNSDVYYSMDKDSIKVKETEGVIEATLNLASASDGTIAQTLDLTMTVYQNGILRLLIEEPDVKRFRISQDPVLEPVVDDQLFAVNLLDKISWSGDDASFSISGITHEHGDESWEYTVDLARFMI